LWHVDSGMWNDRRSISKPGFWNDLDALQLGGKGQAGGGMTLTWTEYRSQFSLYCILASPLIFSADIIQFYRTENTLGEDMQDILMNKEMIAINQDPLGLEGLRVSPPNVTGGEAWARQLKDGKIAVALFNRGNTTIDVEVTFSQLLVVGLQPREEHWYEARDVWAGKYLGIKVGAVSMRVAPHETAVVTLSPRNGRGDAVEEIVA